MRSETISGVIAITIIGQAIIYIGNGCISREAAVDLVASGVEVADQIQAEHDAQKAAEKAAKEAAAKAEAERLAAEQAERDRIESERQAAEEAAEAAGRAGALAKYDNGPTVASQGVSRTLWKAVSESNGKPVYILNEWFTDKTDARITVNGSVYKRTGIANEYREHYRLPTAYSGPVTVSVKARTGRQSATWQRWTWIFPDGTQRWDGKVTPTVEPIME